MKITMVAGFGPVVQDVDASRTFWGESLGIPLKEDAPQYFTNNELDGVRYFALWALSQASESTFGTDAWPDDIPPPQAWVELDVESPQAVGEAVTELQAAGHRVLRGAHEEPWGQTTSRVLSPEGLLIGVTYTPWMHQPPTGDAALDAEEEPGPITES
jgi:catechol 2,3-dioxygenase-like lactoylglutathione lyase family enzyme